MTIKSPRVKEGNRITGTSSGRVMKIEYKVIAASIILGLFFWVIDAMLDYLLFYEGTFWSLLISDVPNKEIYLRTLVLGLFLVFGAYVSVSMGVRKKAELAVKESEERIRQ